MRVDGLHRQIVDDVLVMQKAVQDVLPVHLPARYIHQQMNLRAFLKRLNAVTTPLNVYNEIELDKSQAVGIVKQSGLWLASDELPENDSTADIRILWEVHPDTKLVRMTQPEWDRRRYYFWAMFMHELVHRAQWNIYRKKVNHGERTFVPRTTKRGLKKEQLYLGNFDEIESYSHDTALECLLWWKDLSLKDAIYESNTFTGRLIIPTYVFFTSSFEDTPNHPALTHFHRKLKAWYTELKKHPEIYSSLELPNLVAS